MSGLSPSLPLSLGRYTLLERVGGGGMATVYRATLAAEEGFQKEVAVKVVRDELASDGQFTALFLDEARLAARLSHANVVQTFDFGQVDGIYYLAMEFVPGRTLSGLTKVLRTRGLSLGVVRSVHIAAEVAKGLGYAHRLSGPDGRPLGLVHRDVSPQNVLVSNEGEVKLADFGIAKAAMRSHVTQPGRVRGKCAYMAPEQARGLEVDARADVFALGIVLWECLTGVALFDGPSDAAILLQVVEKEIPPPSRFVPELPPVLDEAVMRLLARDRNARPESCAPVARLLADINLGLVRSHADIDLAELQRSLTSGTAVLPVSLLSDGGAQAGAGAALPPSGGTPVSLRPEPVAAPAFDPRAETVTPESSQSGTRVDSPLLDETRRREPVDASTVVEGARVEEARPPRALEEEGAPALDPRTRTAERRRTPGRRLAIGAGSIVGAALALVVLVRWLGGGAPAGLEQDRVTAAGLELGGAGRELPASSAGAPGTGTEAPASSAGAPGTGTEARRGAAAPAAGAAPVWPGPGPGTRAVGTSPAGSSPAGSSPGATAQAGPEARRVAAAPAAGAGPTSPGTAPRAAAPATAAPPREGGKASSRPGELVVSSKRAEITVVLDHDARRSSQRLTAQQPIRLPAAAGQHFLTFAGIGMKTCVVAVELPAGGRLAVQLDAQGMPELLVAAERRPLTCLVR